MAYKLAYVQIYSLLCLISFNSIKKGFEIKRSYFLLLSLEHVHTKILALPKSQTLTWWERGSTYQTIRKREGQHFPTEHHEQEVRIRNRHMLSIKKNTKPAYQNILRLNISVTNSWYSMNIS